MDSETQTYYRLLDEYEERFGVGPPVFHFGDDAQGIKLMQMAIDRGRPLTAADVGLPPPGVVY
jgi:hypothetical protein